MIISHAICTLCPHASCISTDRKCICTIAAFCTRKMKSLFLIILFILPVTIANDCPLPNNTHVLTPLKGLLQDSGGDGSQTFSPTITESIQYVCLAQGNMINTYKTVSVIATYTPNPGVSSETSIFQLICSNGVWTADNSGGLAAPDSSVINATTRTDCVQCRHSNGHDRCRCKLIHENNHYTFIIISCSM